MNSVENIKSVTMNKFFDELAKSKINTKPLSDILSGSCNLLTAAQSRLAELHVDIQRLERIQELRDPDKMRASLAASSTIEVFQQVNAATSSLATALEHLRQGNQPTPVGTA